MRLYEYQFSQYVIASEYRLVSAKKSIHGHVLFAAYINLAQIVDQINDLLLGKRYLLPNFEDLYYGNWQDVNSALQLST
jgi:hypothetical protein